MNEISEIDRIVRKVPLYPAVLEREVALGTLRKDDSVLIACGGTLDRAVMLKTGFENVVISNLAPHGGDTEYSPFQWQRQDLENLALEDNSFDVAIVHEGLHHCYNPMRALGELCRVARKLVLGFEPYDTPITRLSARLGYVQEYEDSAVYHHGGTGGGVANSEIPNFVYRFSEWDLRKFINTLYPHAKVPIRFYRELRVNRMRNKMLRNRVRGLTLECGYAILGACSKLIPACNNGLAFAITKPTSEHYHRWIREEDGDVRVDQQYLEQKFAKRG